MVPPLRWALYASKRDCFDIERESRRMPLDCNEEIDLVNLEL